MNNSIKEREPTSPFASFASALPVSTLLIFCMLTIPLMALAQEPAGQEALAREPRMAPRAIRQVSDVQPYMGFVPPEIDLSHIRATMPDSAQPLATHFDWREVGGISPVKNQGACGSCYAFAAVANFEARVLIDGGSALDFSENNAKECDWYGSSCNGGNFDRMAHLFSTKGTVLEACDPYVASDVACNASCPYSKTLLDWRIISTDQVASTEVLKAYLQTYGPIYTSMYAGSGDAWGTEFHSYDGSYTLYYSGVLPANHAVMIVGFDDDLVHAGGQGAWIVKNSWGSDWGGPCGYGTEGGYFTIAYGSARLGGWASFIYDWQDYDPNGTLLYNDEAGRVGSVGYGNPTCWGLVKFVAPEDLTLQRVEFWTLDVTEDVDVYVYDDFSGSTTSNLLASELNRSFENAGYHSVELSTPVEISSGDDVYAVVKFRDQSYFYPVSYDFYGPQATGCNYLSPTGTSFSPWSGGDLGIRVRATRAPSCGTIIEEPGILDILDIPSDNGGYVEVSWRRSIYDQEESTPAVTRYKVWRRRKETLPVLLTAGSIAGPFEHGETGPAWEMVGMVPATGECCYTLNAPTERDSSGSNDYWTYFCVTAHTGLIGEHFDSPVDCGYSVDNLGTLSRGRDEGRGTTYLSVPQPNPGKGGFAIEFGLSASDWVQLEVYDIRGRRVATLLEGHAEAGRHSVTWDPGNSMGPGLSPGLYFLRLLTTSEARAVKLILMS